MINSQVRVRGSRETGSTRRNLRPRTRCHVLRVAFKLHIKTSSPRCFYPQDNRVNLHWTHTEYTVALQSSRDRTAKGGTKIKSKQTKPCHYPRSTFTGKSGRGADEVQPGTLLLRNLLDFLVKTKWFSFGLDVPLSDGGGICGEKCTIQHCGERCILIGQVCRMWLLALCEKNK